MNVDDALMLSNYIEHHLFAPKSVWPIAEFKQRSYSRLVAYDILRLLIKYPNKDSIDLIENYIIGIEYLKHYADTKEGENMFKIICDAAYDILSLFKLKGEKRW